ncbi:MAG: nitroreductase family protein [Syntrophobacteraceae bacterium]
MDLLNSIKERRSINFFEPGLELEDAKIKELISIANLSPSSFNLQPWRVIVVRNKERKQALRACAMNQPKVEEASAVLIIIADPEAVELHRERMLQSFVEVGYLKEEQKESIRGMTDQLYKEKESLTRKIFAVKNASLFAMNLMNAARGLGLETHPMDGFDESCIKREFGIPEDKIIPMLIAVGYLKKGVTLLPRAFRRKIEEFTGFDTYR